MADSLEGAADGGLTVSFRIANTGKEDGDEIPQVYLGAPRDNASAAAFPIRSLAAFDRLSLKAGESRTVSLHVAQRRLQYWSTSDERCGTGEPQPKYQRRSFLQRLAAGAIHRRNRFELLQVRGAMQQLSAIASGCSVNATLHLPDLC
jgi:hypothetical protein